MTSEREALVERLARWFADPTGAAGPEEFDGFAPEYRAGCVRNAEAVLNEIEAADYVIVRADDACDLLDGWGDEMATNRGGLIERMNALLGFSGDDAY